MWCRIIGHDWIQLPGESIKVCGRCSKKEDWYVKESHEDPDAEIGEVRWDAEMKDDTVIFKKRTYRCTAHGPDTAYYQWWDSTALSISYDELQELMEEIEALKSSDK